MSAAVVFFTQWRSILEVRKLNYFWTQFGGILKSTPEVATAVRRRPRRLALLLSLVLGLGMLAPEYARARHRLPETMQVPLARLIGNLEGRVRENPDPWRRLNLARGYSMAYALNNDPRPLTVRSDGGNLSLLDPTTLDYFPTMPPKVSAVHGGAARGYLDAAIKVYAALLRDAASEPYLGPRARLGHAWCLEQSGDRNGALAGYRALVSETGVPSRERGAPARPMTPGADWTDASAEAAGYLVAMLSPTADAPEIALLQTRLAHFGARPRAITPIAIPLKKGTALADIEDRRARVAFDVDGRSVGTAWSWITPKAGWLAYDPKQTRKIDSGIRLFGNVSYWMFWENGYQALAILDDNQDGILNGVELAGLVVWVDRNGDGVCGEQETRTLAQLGIVGLRFGHVPVPGHPDRIVHAPQGVQYMDGSSGPSYDIVLHSWP